MIVALGAFGYEAAWAALRGDAGVELPARRPRFAHGARSRRAAASRSLGAFHPSQQNTFTGRLTPAMLDAVFARARSAQSSSAMISPTA